MYHHTAVSSSRTRATRETPPAGPVRFTVPGLPVPKARARVTRSGFAYTPKATVNAEAAVRYAYLGAVPGRPPIPAGVPIRLEIMAHFPVPASAPKAVRAAVYAGAAIPMSVRPDIDNLVKTVLDALNGLAWADDGQVAQITARKFRTTGRARLHVSVAEIVPSPSVLGPSQGLCSFTPTGNTRTVR